MAMLKQNIFSDERLEVERLAENETKSFLVVVVFNLPHLRHGSLWRIVVKDRCEGSLWRIVVMDQWWMIHDDDDDDDDDGCGSQSWLPMMPTLDFYPDFTAIQSLGPAGMISNFTQLQQQIRYGMRLGHQFQKSSNQLLPTDFAGDENGV